MPTTRIAGRNHQHPSHLICLALRTGNNSIAPTWPTIRHSTVAIELAGEVYRADRFAYSSLRGCCLIRWSAGAGSVLSGSISLAVLAKTGNPDGWKTAIAARRLGREQTEQFTSSQYLFPRRNPHVRCLVAHQLELRHGGHSHLALPV